jgi:hypothetical protein
MKWYVISLNNYKDVVLFFRLYKDFHQRPKYEELLEHEWLKDIDEDQSKTEFGTFLGSVLDAYEVERQRLLGV